MNKNLMLVARNDLVTTHKRIAQSGDTNGAVAVMQSSTFQYCLNVLSPDNPAEVSEEQATMAYFAGLYILEHPDRA